MINMKDCKPDLLVMLKLKFDIKVDFFVCEIKNQVAHHISMKPISSRSNDMKSIIDQQMDLSVDNPVCHGLLVEGKHTLQHKFCQKTHCVLLGFDCYLYQMSLDTKLNTDLV